MIGHICFFIYLRGNKKDENIRLTMSESNNINQHNFSFVIIDDDEAWPNIQ